MEQQQQPEKEGTKVPVVPLSGYYGYIVYGWMMCRVDGWLVYN